MVLVGDRHSFHQVMIVYSWRRRFLKISHLILTQVNNAWSSTEKFPISLLYQKKYVRIKKRNIVINLSQLSSVIRMNLNLS